MDGADGGQPAGRYSRDVPAPASRSSLAGRTALEALAVTGAVAAVGRIIVGPLRGLPAEDGVNRWLQARRTPWLDRATWALSTYSDTVPTILTAAASGVVPKRVRASARISCAWESSPIRASEVISRALSEFQRRGWVEQARGAIRLLDLPSLEKLAREPGR